MAKTNALITKYRVEVDTDNIFGSDIVQVGGLSLGEEGMIEVPEQDKIAQVSDGVVKYAPLDIKFRLSEGLVTFDYFLALWDERASRNTDIAIIETRRDGVTELFRWIFTDCEMKKFASAEDLVLGEIKVKQIDTSFAFNEARILKA